MTIKLYTTAELEALQQMPKRVTNPKARWSKKPEVRPSHRQRNFSARGDDDEMAEFQIYQRQNLNDEMDFSCGIIYRPRGAEKLTLVRYDGPSHVHGDIDFRPHIHRASERAIAMGKKPELEAVETDRFQCVEGAFACLVADFRVTGLDSLSWRLTRGCSDGHQHSSAENALVQPPL